MKFVSAVPWYLLTKKMPWYAVAKGRNPGIYKTWPECQAEILNFRGAKFHKFNTEIEAINFVNEGAKSGLQNKTQHTVGEKHGENIISEQLLPSSSSSQKTDTQTLSPDGTSEITNKSSPRQTGRALTQHLSFLERRYEDAMKEIRTEIDRVRERVETFNNEVNAPSNKKAHERATVTEEVRGLQEDLKQLSKRFTDSTTEFRAEISSLKLAVSVVQFGQNKIQPEGECDIGITARSCKRNQPLILEAAGPSTTTARSYSTTGRDKTISNKRKIRMPDQEVEPSKVLKVELPDADKIDSKNVFPGFEVDTNGYVHVYTDGACENNGKVGARAGIGVWFADNHPLNYSEPVRGRPTNNTAEIQAAICAIELAKRAGIEKLLLHTDSQFLINCITVWIHKWKMNDWKLSDGGKVKNKEDLLALDEALEGICVKWDHVRGHRGNHGNEMADALARAGAKKRY